MIIDATTEAIKATIKSIAAQLGLTAYQLHKRSMYKLAAYKFLGSKNYNVTLDSIVNYFGVLGYQVKIQLIKKTECLTDEELAQNTGHVVPELVARLRRKEFHPVSEGLPTEEGVLYRTVNGKYNICCNRVMDDWYVKKFGVKEWLYLKYL